MNHRTQSNKKNRPRRRPHQKNQNPVTKWVKSGEFVEMYQVEMDGVRHTTWSTYILHQVISLIYMYHENPRHCFPRRYPCLEHTRRVPHLVYKYPHSAKPNPFVKSRSSTCTPLRRIRKARMSILRLKHSILTILSI